MSMSEVLSQSERGALDNVLRPHLRLEPVPESTSQQNGKHKINQYAKIHVCAGFVCIQMVYMKKIRLHVLTDSYFECVICARS